MKNSIDGENEIKKGLDIEGTRIIIKFDFNLRENIVIIRTAT